MKINWLPENSKNTSEVKDSLKLEYAFRQKATLVLLDFIENKNWIDLGTIEFNFNPNLKQFSLSKNTPEPAYSLLSELSSQSISSKIPWLISI